MAQIDLNAMNAVKVWVGKREELVVNEKFLFAKLLNPDTVWYSQRR